MWNPFLSKHKSPVITDAKSLYDSLERSESSTRNLAEGRKAIEGHCNQTTIGAWIHLHGLGEL